MGEFEALGDAVTGSLLARAVEPKAGEPGADGHTRERNCLNCGASLTGPFCAACGQKAHIHRSMRAFFQDFIQGLLNFEGKIWRTLPMLAWRPGEMTRRYIAGERARFISPVALYLFSVFLMFAVLNMTGGLNSNAPGVVNSNLDFVVSEQNSAIAKLEKERGAKAAAGSPLAEIDRQIASEKSDLVQLQKVRKRGFTTDLSVDEDTPAWVGELVDKVTENPELAVYKVQDAASKFSWLLIPISVPFLWLLFPLRRRYKTYDHAVFVTYSLSFMMLLVVAGGLLVASGMTGLAGFLFFVPPFHMYRHLKGAYELGRFSALARTVALVTFAFVAAGLFVTAAATIGMM